MDRLNERSEKVLLAIIQTHIASNCPVGSFKVTRRFSFNLSPATIRNTMAELEEDGYITQPHTSAGRIPTEKGYRYYVDILLKRHESGKGILEDLYKRLRSLEKDFHKMIIETSRALAVTTKCIGIVTPPQTDDIVLRHVKFIKYDKTETMCILISEGGIVKNKMIKLKGLYSQRQLERVADYLNNRFAGEPIREIKAKITSQISREKIICDELITNALLSFKDAISDEDDEIMSGLTGTSNLPDFVNIKRIKDILRAIEDKQLILNLLEKVSKSEGLQVLVGLQDVAPSMKEMSMIASTYTNRLNARGTVGVIGPTRMNYKKLIPIVEQTANTLTHVLIEV
ncbi:MAG: heat-inducible transcriptional repressor HrcA [Thermodesulfovibrionia bacterium]